MAISPLILTLQHFGYPDGFPLLPSLLIHALTHTLPLSTTRVDLNQAKSSLEK